MSISPAAAESERAVKCAPEDDPHDSGKSVGRELLRAGDEVARSIVEECIDAADSFFGGLDSLLHGGEVTNVAGSKARARALGLKFFRGGFQRLRPPRDKKQIRAELREAQRHRAAESGPAAGDQNVPPLQQVALIHVNLPCGSPS